MSQHVVPAHCSSLEAVAVLALSPYSSQPLKKLFTMAPTSFMINLRLLIV